MSDKEFVGGSVLMLALATIYLLVAALVIALAREGFVPWSDASGTIDVLSLFGSLMVGAILLGHTTRRKAKVEVERD